MKETIQISRIIILLVFIQSLFYSPLCSQTPGKLSYQAIIRNNSNALVADTQIGIQISIVHGSPSGIVVYAERQTPVTNSHGLVSIEIGNEAGFDFIDWEHGPYFIKTEIDLEGGLNYSIIGTSPILSVPYAFHAQTADSLTDELPEKDPVFSASPASQINEDDILLWNNKLDHYTETQTLADVLSIGNSANGQIKNLSDPTDAQDAVTKAFLEAYVEKMLNELGVDFTKFRDVRDGTIYSTVKIGNQVWMAENLRFLPAVYPPTAASCCTPHYYVYGYNGSDVNEAKATDAYKKYGVLYNWPAAMENAVNSWKNPSEVQGVCPAGWHLPSITEWRQLINYLGDEAGNKLREAGIDHWASPNIGATNETGFSARPGAARFSSENSWTDIHWAIQYACWWTTSESEDLDQWVYYLTMMHNECDVHTYDDNKDAAFYVRCVKD